MGAQSVKIPVELEMRMKDISSQIEQIRKAMGQVRPDTKGYQHLETLLKSIEHEFQNIKKQSTESFSTHGQINNFGRKFEHLQGLAKDFGEEFKKLDFSAFKDSAFDKTFVDQINSAQDSITALKEEISILGNNAFLQTAKSSQELVDTLQDLEAGSIESLVDEKKNIEALENIKKSSKSLQEELKKVESSKKTKTDTKDREERDLRKKEVNLTSARQSYAALQKNVADATAELERFKKVQEGIQTQQLKKQSSRMEDNLNRLNVEKANLKNKTGRANSDFFDGKGEKLNKTKLIQHLLKDYSFTNDDLEKAGVLSLTEQSLDTFYKNLATLLKEKKAEFDEKINTINKDVQNAESALKKAQTEEGKGKQTLETAQDFYDAQKKEVDQLATEISSLEKRANNIQATIDRNTTAAAALEKANSDKVTAMDSASQIQQIADLEKRIEELENQLRSSIKAFQDTENATEDLSNGAKGAEGPLKDMGNSLDQVTESTRRLENIQGAIKRWFGFNEVINLTKRAVRDAINHIRELDKVMTEIAVVTDMGQEDLWGQISTYSKIAQEYGVSTVGVYEVSQLYYQQGLATAEVMQLTEETLKMAKIANIDYADATDYMTVAIRGFKLEMSDAQNIVDVYSNIAAVTASDTEELAVAMSKTASSAEAVGASFENTTAMIALMVETTREAPQNIGSALKSIISRYGEMTSDPSAIVDSEGEEMSLNRVDKALKSIGISLQDTSGQFRDFDEVILELSSKWGTLDVNTQRYIATIMAGNRQQSRFLALVGNYDRLSELYEEAANSQDAATLQTLKTMDSIETKINQLKTAFQEFYTSTGIENLIKGVIDFVTVVIERINGIPKAFDKIPLAAIGMIGTLITTGKMGLSVLIGSLFKTFNSYLPEVKVEGVKMGEAIKEGFELGIKGMGEKAQKELKISKSRAKWGTALGSIGSLVSTLALTLGNLETVEGRVISGLSQIAGGAASAFGQILTGNYIGAAITAVSTLTSAIATMEETTEEKIDRLKKNVEESSNESLLSKNELKTLIDYKKKYEQLAKSQYESIEAKQEFLDLQNEIAEKYPELISYIDTEGNHIVSLGESYEDLAKAKSLVYQEDFFKNFSAEMAGLNDLDYILSTIYNTDPLKHVDNPYLWFEKDYLGEIGALIPQVAQGEDFSDLILKQKYIPDYYGLGLGDITPKLDLPYLRDDDFDSLFEDYFTYDEGPHGEPIYEVSKAGKQAYANLVEEMYDLAGQEHSFVEAQKELIQTHQLEPAFIELINSFDEDIYTYFQKSQSALKMQSVLVGSAYEQAANEYLIFISSLTDISLGNFQKQIALNKINPLWEDYKIKNKSGATGSYQVGDHFIDESGTYRKFTEADLYAEFLEETLTPFWLENFKNGNELFQDLTNKQSEQIDKIFNELMTYNIGEGTGDLENILSELGANADLIEFFEIEWVKQAGEIQDRFRKGLLKTANKDENSEFSKDLNEIISNIAPYLLDLVYQQFEYALKDVEESSDKAEKSTEALTSFYNSLNSLGPEAERIAANADLTSLSGIETMFTEMETAGIDISKINITDWINTLVVNLDLEWETYSNKIAEGMKSFEKAITNASEGMDLEEAIAMANKLGVTLDNFRFEDGKYFYDDLDSLTKAYQDFSDRLRTSLEEQTNQIKSFVSSYNKDTGIWELKKGPVSGITGMTDEGFEFADDIDTELQTFLSSRFEAYQAWLKKNYKGESGLGRINEFILSELESLDDSTNQMINEYQKRLLAMAALSAKNLSEFFTKMDFDADEQNLILEALKTGDTSGLEGDALRVYYEYEDELTGLITSTISDMTDAALEAISSGKTQRINITNLDQYNKELYKQISSGQLIDEGISFQQEGNQSYALIGSNVSESIYKQLLKAMNYTDEQYNEAMAEFFSAKTKDVEGALGGVLSDTKKIDYSSIADFATALGDTTVDNLLEKGIFALNPDNLTYHVKDFRGLEQEVQDKVTYAQEMIRDSISNYLDEVFGYVSNGISGSMSNVEFAQLQDFISGYDPNLKLQITETADGLKLTQDSVLQVYSILKVINPLAAQVTLKELAESAIDANEDLNNIYTVLDKIKDIENELKQKPSDDRKKMLLEELNVAKEIRKTLIEAGNAFNFMERPVPTDETNPLSAWEGMAQFLEVINGEAFAAGKMLYSDFNAIANLLDEGNITLMNAAGESIQAIGLLAQGQQSLVIEDGQVFVGLEQLGEQFNISGEQYAESVKKAVQQIAKAEIERLSAQKLLLEGISFTSETNKLAQQALEDGKIETDEIIQYNEDGIKRYTKSAEQIFSAFVKLAEYAGFDLGAGFINIAELFSNLSEESFINTFSFIGDILLLAQTDIDAAIEKLKSSTKELNKINEEVNISQGILPPETGSKEAEGAAEDGTGGPITNPPEIEVPATLKVKPQQIILVDEAGNTIEVISLDGNYLATANISVLEGKIGEETTKEPVSTGTITFPKNDLDSWGLTGDLNILTGLYDGAKITKETEGLEGIEKIEIPLTEENVLTAVGTLDTIISSYKEGKTDSEVSGAVTVNDIPLIDESILVALGILNTVKARYEEATTEGIVNEKVVFEDLDLAPDSVLKAIGILNLITGRQDNSTDTSTEKVTAENIPLTTGSFLTALGYLNGLVAEYIEGTTSKDTRDADNQEFAITGSHAEGDLVSATATYVPDETDTDVSGLEGKKFTIKDALTAEGEASSVNVTLTPETEIVPLGKKTFEIDGKDFNFKITKLNESGEAEEVKISIPVEPDTENLDDLANRIKEALIAQGFSAGQAGSAANELVLTATVQVDDKYTPSEELDEIASLINSEDNTVDIIVKEEGSEKVQTAVDDLIEKNKDKTISLNFEIKTSAAVEADQIFNLNDFSDDENKLQSQLSNYVDYTYGFPVVKYATVFENVDKETYEKQSKNTGYGAAAPVENATKIKTGLEEAKKLLEQGYQLAQEDIQYITELNNIISKPDAPDWTKSLPWVEELSSVLKLLELPSNYDPENGLVESITRLGEVQVGDIVQAIIDLTQNSTILSTLSFDQFNSFITSLSSAVGPDSQAATGLNTIKSTLEELSGKGYQIDLSYKVNSGLETDGTYTLEVNDNQTITTLMNLATALFTLNTQAATLINTANSMTDNGPSQVSAMSDAMGSIRDRSGAVRNTAAAINQLRSKDITATITVEVLGAGHISSAKFEARAGGNFAYAKGTLMGELGPELVASGGRYYTVGNYGAEFVDLPSDAIVFNHLQTKKLLNNGSISSTGTPKESEKKSVAMATGNITGPARAKSTDDEIKEIDDLIRLWQGLAGYDAKSLGQKAAGGAGGKGGEIDPGFLGDLERWYNLLRQIEKLEQQISYEQAHRANLQSGYDYVISLEKELQVLEKQQATYSKLAKLQKDYYDQRRKDLQTTEYSKIFTYDEDGLMQYVEGKGFGLDILATLNETDAQGVAKRSAQQQVDYLKGLGFDISEFMKKSDGTEIEATDYAGIIEQFWTGVDNWMSELDGLYDEYNDHLVSIQENQESQQEIIQEYIDNQRAVEDKLFQAIEDREQAEIDRFQKNLDATQEATSKYLEGLNRALDKEREMYNRNEEDAETTRLQRQLAILQRSGGSASEIRSLQDQIDSRLQDSYFSEQERQIQAVQEASDLQLEKMQQQLDVMNETLEYQKENGLLWQEVSDMMMSWTPEAMMDFIERFTKTYREDSLLENEEKTKETLKELEIWYAKQQENGRGALWETYLEGAKTRYDEKVIEDNELKAKEAYLSALRDNKTEAEASAAADEIFNNIKKPQDTNAGSSNEPDNNKETIETPVKKSYYIATYSSLTGGGQTIGYNTEAEARRAAIAAIDAATAAYFKNNPDVPATSYLGQAVQAYKNGIKIKKYAEGGLVDFTGPAWVDGTKAKPEAFLSADDTALLKSKIFSNSNYSLKSVIEMLESLGRAFSSIDNSSNNREVVFENVEVNIAANAIASDYDARRAGEQVLEELMSIARRNSNIGVARR